MSSVNSLTSPGSQSSYHYFLESTDMDCIKKQIEFEGDKHAFSFVSTNSLGDPIIVGVTFSRVKDSFKPMLKEKLRDLEYARDETVLAHSGIKKFK